MIYDLVQGDKRRVVITSETFQRNVFSAYSAGLKLCGPRSKDSEAETGYLD